ncbi:hypothetical protein [Salinicola acroporae]|uniref:hypothetical protein n=1 Tax=Salinicola acroporae TaxID=1541440 RepID=UPI0024542810|nr:hypothetical protein [Salinicola acroporae]
MSWPGVRVARKGPDAQVFGLLASKGLASVPLSIFAGFHGWLAGWPDVVSPQARCWS